MDLKIEKERRHHDSYIMTGSLGGNKQLLDLKVTFWILCVPAMIINLFVTLLQNLRLMNTDSGSILYLNKRLLIT